MQTSLSRFMQRAGLAALVALGPARTLQAQALPPQAPSGARPERVVVIDTAGREFRGELVRFEPESVTLNVGPFQHTLPLATVSRIERRGDPPWDGAAKGLAVAASLICIVIGAGDDPIFDTRADTPDDFTLADTVSMVTFLTAFGFGVDLLHVGRTTLYAAPDVRPGTTGAPSAAVARRPSGRRAGLAFGMRFRF